MPISCLVPFEEHAAYVEALTSADSSIRLSPALINHHIHGAGAVNILLIYPEFPDTFWSFRYALKFIRKKSISPPLGLLTIAAMLPAAWNKRLVDLNTRQLRDEDLAWADYVFISGMAVQRRSAREVSIIGTPYASYSKPQSS